MSSVRAGADAVSGVAGERTTFGELVVGDRFHLILEGAEGRQTFEKVEEFWCARIGEPRFPLAAIPSVRVARVVSPSLRGEG